MTKRINVSKTRADAITEFPDEFAQCIGHFILKHSFLESVLIRTLYLTVGITPETEEIGKVVISQPRSFEALDRIRTVMKLKGYQLAYDTKTLRDKLLLLKNFRDAIAHGVFFDDEGQISFLDFTKKWDVGARNENWPKYLRPEWVALTPKYFQERFNELDEAFEQIQAFDSEVRQLLASSPQTPQPQTQMQVFDRGHKQDPDKP